MVRIITAIIASALIAGCAGGSTKAHSAQAEMMVAVRVPQPKALSLT